MGGNKQRNAQGEALGLAETGVKAGVAAVRVPVSEGRNSGADDFHRSCCFGEHPENHDRFHRQGHGSCETIKKGLEFYHPWQAPVPEQVGDLLKGTILREIQGVISSIYQAAIYPINKTDFRITGHGVGKSCFRLF